MTEHPSYPATIYWDNAGGTSWTKIAQTQDFEGPTISRNMEEIMHRDRGSFYMRYIPGMTDGGEYSTTLVFDPTDSEHTDLIANLDSGPCTVPAWKLDLGLCSGEGTAYWLFDGFVSEFSPNSPVEGVHTADITVKIDGEPTFNYA